MLLLHHRKQEVPHRSVRRFPVSKSNAIMFGITTFATRSVDEGQPNVRERTEINNYSHQQKSDKAYH
jgi:hypothetical protein